MTDRALLPEIVTLLSRKIGKREGTVRKDIYLLKRKYSGLPINSVAQIYALQSNTSVLQKLSKAEKSELPNIELEKPAKVVQKKPRTRGERIIEFVKFQSSNPFVRAHIDETNRAYTYRCYTACFILCRKILENLLTDIIRKKFPPRSKDDIELFFDTTQRRTKDFSVILENLTKHSKDFGPDQKLLQRIIQRSGQFKDDANDKTHSWYHLVRTRKELDDTSFQDIIEMIAQLEKNQFP